jgi:HEAT repeat protein
MLGDQHTSVRVQSTQALGQIGGERAVLALGEILVGDGNKRQRIVAAWGLARQNTEQARRFLDLAVDDPDEQIREAASKPPVWVDQPETDFLYSGPEAIQ